MTNAEPELNALALNIVDQKKKHVQGVSVVSLWTKGRGSEGCLGAFERLGSHEHEVQRRCTILTLALSYSAVAAESNLNKQ
jgi:hypothetical protein